MYCLNMVVKVNDSDHHLVFLKIFISAEEIVKRNAGDVIAIREIRKLSVGKGKIGDSSYARRCYISARM